MRSEAHGRLYLPVAFLQAPDGDILPSGDDSCVEAIYGTEVHVEGLYDHASRSRCVDYRGLAARLSVDASSRMMRRQSGLFCPDVVHCNSCKCWTMVVVLGRNGLISRKSSFMT